MYRSTVTFEKGSILRKEMLTDLYEYPRIAIETRYASYTDGILYGLEWRADPEKPGSHLITPGALKFQGELYFLADFIDVEAEFPDLEIDGKYRLFFVKQQEERVIDARTVYPLKLEAVQSAGLAEARQNGYYYAYIECAADKTFLLIDDPKELYGLLAADDGYAYRFSCRAVRKIKEILEEKKDKHPLDYRLLQDIYENRGVSVSLVNLYLKEAGIGHMEEDSANPLELLKQFTEVCGTLQLSVNNVVKIPEAPAGQERTSQVVVHATGQL